MKKILLTLCLLCSFTVSLYAVTVEETVKGNLTIEGNLTITGTFTDGTTSIAGGNYTGVGNITGDDVDISAGTGDYTSSGTIASGDITIFDATPILVFKDSNSLGAASVGFIEWRDSGGGRAGFLGNNTSGNDDFLWKNEQGGNIGIQTTGGGELQIFANVDLNSNDLTTAGNISITGFGAGKLLLGDTAIGIYSQADTFMDLFADGGVRIGDSSAGAPTNFVLFGSTGNQSFNGTAEFHPPRISQAGEPGLSNGELVIWHDSDDNKVYMVYDDATEGAKKIELI